MRAASSVTADGTSRASYGYDAAGNLLTTTLPTGNGYVETRAYDTAGRLSEVRNSRLGTDLSVFAYTRDPVGNPTRVDKLGGAVETYDYDSRDRLTEVCFQATCTGGSDPFIRWSYDDVGNRLTETRPAGMTAYAYDDADQLTGRSGLGGSVSYSYDANGNQLSARGPTPTIRLTA